ncbi:hypothetical protein Pst134EA_024435 [Puccinia striiformis f. sp. tritici]|uniref:hypothetical protein n=1 Tax=Puccinia striiformis f. sp. tritici TaxID=168172 RepID=UPI0020081A23|nr:hypothetical protein Pst134EA_024435 [Puccinia striiformis f. sp. tritici]KAH9453566.1 hypothetical protein Pst134EA_024435 [Puccinia striiformis f. sp. tritici]
MMGSQTVHISLRQPGPTTAEVSSRIQLNELRRNKYESGPLPSFKTDSYPIALQNPAHPTTNQTHNVNQQIYHQIDQLRQFEDKHNESYNDTQSDSTSDKHRSRSVYQSRKGGIVEIKLLLSTFVESQ